MRRYLYNKNGIGLTALLVIIVATFLALIILAKIALNPKPKKETLSPQPILDLPRPPIKSKTPTQGSEEIPPDVLR